MQAASLRELLVPVLHRMQQCCQVWLQVVYERPDYAGYLSLYINKKGAGPLRQVTSTGGLSHEGGPALMCKRGLAFG